MEQLVQRVVTLAKSLDDLGLQEFSSVADDVALSLVKTAQYVGSQGYWIRNERCWTNCYRQKRASSPKKASQEIWFECQEEYQDSINNDGGSWDKYAESDSVTKQAKLDIKLADKLKNVQDIPEKLTQLSNEARMAHRDAYLSATENMLNIAEATYDNYPELHKEALEISSELMKEAGWWDNLKDVGNAVKQKGSDMWNNPAGKNSPGAGQGFMGRYRANQDIRNQQKIQNTLQQRLQYLKQYQPNSPEIATLEQQISQQSQQQQPQQDLSKLRPMSTTDQQGTVPSASSTDPVANPQTGAQQTVQNTQTTQPVPQFGTQIDGLLSKLDKSRQNYAINFIQNSLLPFLNGIGNDNKAFEQGMSGKFTTPQIQAKTKKVLFKL